MLQPHEYMPRDHTMMMSMMMTTIILRTHYPVAQETIFTRRFTYQVWEALSRETIGGFDGRGRQRMSCNIEIIRENLFIT